MGGGQEASHVTTTDRRAGKFEAKFFHKVAFCHFMSIRTFRMLNYNSYAYSSTFLLPKQILQEEIGGVKGHFGPINALAFNPDGRRFS